MAAFSTNFEDTLGKLVAWQKETAESGSEATDKQKTFFETINEGMSELMGEVNWEGLTDALGFASDIFGQIADEAKETTIIKQHKNGSGSFEPVLDEKGKQYSVTEFLDIIEKLMI